jgi:hypothetical protein
MAKFETVPSHMHLAAAEAMTQAQFGKRVDFNIVVNFSAAITAYDDAPAADVM